MIVLEALNITAKDHVENGKKDDKIILSDYIKIKILFQLCKKI